MRKWIKGGLVTILSLLLASCAGSMSNTAPDQILSLLQTGRPLLTCRESCLVGWLLTQPRAQQLDASGQWQSLAVTVVQNGYQDDLSLFYLGRAAEGLGFYAGAASYYRQSVEISGTSLACQYTSHSCGGVVLPGAASMRLASVQQMIRAAERPVYRSRPATATPTPNAEAIIEPPPTVR